MKVSVEKIKFTEGLRKARKQMSPIKYKAFRERLMKVIGVETPASLSRHANGKNRTPYFLQLQIDNEFKKEGIKNWINKQ